MTHPYLAALERIERSAWEDLARAAPPPFAAAIGLETRQIGGALFFAAAKIPQFQFNWLAGAGLGGDDGACIGAAVTRFRDIGQTKFIVQIAPGPHAADMENLARGAGLQASPLSWAKFLPRDAERAGRIDIARHSRSRR